MMVSFYAVLFDPRDVLDEILNLIGSVSEGFPSYSYIYIYIYIPTKDISVVSYALQGEYSSGRGFSWGDNTSENGVRKSFGGSVLKCQV